MIQIAKSLIDAAGSRIGVAVVNADYCGPALSRSGGLWRRWPDHPLSGES